MRENKRSNIKKIITAIIIVVFVGYAIFEARSLIQGPDLVIYSPKNNEVVESPILDIQGKARNIFQLTINGRPIFITPDGLFYDKLLLLNGYNTIEVKVKDKFDQESSRILNIVLREPDKIIPAPVIEESGASSTIQTN